MSTADRTDLTAAKAAWRRVRADDERVARLEADLAQARADLAASLALAREVEETS